MLKLMGTKIFTILRSDIFVYTNLCNYSNITKTGLNSILYHKLITNNSRVLTLEYTPSAQSDQSLMGTAGSQASTKLRP